MQYFFVTPNLLFLNAKMFSDALIQPWWGPNREHQVVFTIRSAVLICYKMTVSGTSWSMAYITDLLTSTAEISNMVSILSVLIGLVVMSVFLIRLIYQVISCMSQKISFWLWMYIRVSHEITNHGGFENRRSGMMWAFCTQDEGWQRLPGDRSQGS